MSESASQNESSQPTVQVPVTMGAYKKFAGLTNAAFADRLGITKGYCSDLCNAKEPISLEVSRALERISGIRYHVWIDNDPRGNDRARGIA